MVYSFLRVSFGVSCYWLWRHKSFSIHDFSIASVAFVENIVYQGERVIQRLHFSLLRIIRHCAPWPRKRCSTGPTFVARKQHINDLFCFSEKLLELATSKFVPILTLTFLISWPEMISSAPPCRPQITILIFWYGGAAGVACSARHRKD